MNVHILVRDAEHSRTKQAEILGVVLDPVDLAHLMYDPHALPVGAQLVERDAMLGADGKFYWAELSTMVAAPTFSLQAWNDAVAEDDAVIASLPPAAKARLHPDHMPEAEKRAERAAMRAARVTPEMLAQQDASNAEALDRALSLASQIKADKGKPQ